MLYLASIKRSCGEPLIQNCLKVHCRTANFIETKKTRVSGKPVHEFDQTFHAGYLIR